MEHGKVHKNLALHNLKLNMFQTVTWNSVDIWIYMYFTKHTVCSKDATINMKICWNLPFLFTFSAHFWRKNLALKPFLLQPMQRMGTPVPVQEWGYSTWMQTIRGASGSSSMRLGEQVCWKLVSFKAVKKIPCTQLLWGTCGWIWT